MKSLSKQLSWQISVAVMLTILAIAAGGCALLWREDDNTVYRGLANEAAKAIHQAPGGALTISIDQLPHEFERKTAWMYVIQDDGQSASYGNVPEIYRQLLTHTRVLREGDIRSEDPALAVSIVLQEDGSHRRHIAVGGIGGGKLLEALIPILIFVGVIFALPAAIVLAITVPLIVKRSLVGVRVVAGQAGAIDMERRAQTLDASQVPLEVRPLVSAFNRALSKMWGILESRQKFLSNAAHELRLPITIVKTRASALPDSPTKHAMLTDIVRLQNIADQLLDIQRMDKSPRSEHKIDLAAIVREVGEDCAPLLLEGGYDVSFEAPEEPVLVAGDEGALKRVFTNLLQNALVHGGGRGTIEINVTSSGSVAVSDSGPGIPRQFRTQVFSPFFRLTNESNGSGLGLHLASEIVRLHGGDIAVSESKAGGAEFTVRIPLLGDSP